MFPILDHQDLWKILSAVPGWERDVHEEIPNVVEGYVNFQKWFENPKKTVSIKSYRLPWPELYKTSADHLLGFVKMVNTCMGSEIFELQLEFRYVGSISRRKDVQLHFSLISHCFCKAVSHNWIECFICRDQGTSLYQFSIVSLWSFSL